MDVDAALVRRLEATAATAGLDQVAALRSLDPHSAADGIRFGDGALVAMGAGRYVNRAIGVTLSELSGADVDAIEQFFVGRGLAPMIETATSASPTHKVTCHSSPASRAERKYAGAPAIESLSTLTIIYCCVVMVIAYSARGASGFGAAAAMPLLGLVIPVQ